MFGSKQGGGRRINFWRAGREPVRPVSVCRKQGNDERERKEVKKNATKKKTVSFKENHQEEESERPTVTQHSGWKPDQAAAAAGAERQRQEEQEADKRESESTGGSSGSGDQPEATRDGDEDDEKQEEGRSPDALAVPEGPNNRER